MNRDRGESRLAVETGGTAFIATSEDFSAIFEYVLRDVASGGVGFFVEEGTPLEEGDRINFHLPFEVNERFQDLSGDVARDGLEVESLGIAIAADTAEKIGLPLEDAGAVRQAGLQRIVVNVQRVRGPMERVVNTREQRSGGGIRRILAP
jgi:hypothetical protein